jgi:hypothetical protein
MPDSFSRNYAEARDRFVLAARKAGATLHSYRREDIRGRDGEELAVDVAVLGDRDADSAAIVISGTHGSEAGCGSAIQHRWLCERASAEAIGGLRLVLVHAVNPWGFSHGTRATENNVDLNRNFNDFAPGFSRPNPAYDRLMPFLHGPADSAEAHLAAHRGYRAEIAAAGASIESQAVEGQSAWPDGIFFTGTAPERSNLTFRRIVTDHLSGSRRIGFIDWHTGMGEYGEIVPIVFSSRDSAEYARAARWWQLDRPDGTGLQSPVPARYAGLLWQAIGQEVPGACVAGAVIEFGTGDAYSIFRGDRLDRWLRHEGQDDPDRDSLRRDYVTLCCPTDIAWRRFVLAEGPVLIDRMVGGVADWRG